MEPAADSNSVASWIRLVPAWAWALIAVVVVIGVIGTISEAATQRRAKAEALEREASAREWNAMQASKGRGTPAPSAAPSAKTRADHIADARRACGVEPDAPFHYADVDQVRAACQLTRKATLLDPASASFPGLFDSDRRPATVDGCEWIYKSWVEAKNTYGATIRTKYDCVYSPRTGDARITSLD